MLVQDFEVEFGGAVRKGAEIKGSWGEKSETVQVPVSWHVMVMFGISSFSSLS